MVTPAASSLVHLHVISRMYVMYMVTCVGNCLWLSEVGTCGIFVMRMCIEVVVVCIRDTARQLNYNSWVFNYNALKPHYNLITMS
jgi:hypothetical protein